MNLDLEKLSKLEIVQQMNKLYHSECKIMLTSIYDSLASDHLTLDDIEEIGFNYGVDVQESYRELLKRRSLDEE